jgi:hypothetical protein
MSVVCQSNLKQLGLTFSLYTWDNHGYFHREDSSDWRDNWIPAMRAYYSHEPGIRVCPTTTRFHSEGVTGPFVGWGVYGEGRLQSVPSWAVRGDYGSFGLNAWVANDRGGFHEGRNSRSVQVQGGIRSRYSWIVNGRMRYPRSLTCRRSSMESMLCSGIPTA